MLFLAFVMLNDHGISGHVFLISGHVFLISGHVGPPESFYTYVVYLYILVKKCSVKLHSIYNLTLSENKTCTQTSVHKKSSTFA